MGGRLMSIVLNSAGGGSVTISEPNTASNRTLTLPDNTGTVISTASTGVITQAMMATGVAGTGPAFSAYQTAAQTLAANTQTKLTINAEEYDTASCYDNANYRFTPNVAGYYIVTGGFEIATTQATLTLAIYKNGALEKRVDYKSGNSNAAQGSAIISLNGTTDYIELYALSTATNAISGGNVALTYFQAALVRAA